MSFKFTEIDHGLDELVRTLRAQKAKGSYVKMGIVGASAQATHSPGVTNLDVAMFNEHGTRHMPARPFIGPSFDKNRPKYERQLATGLRKIYEGTMEPEQVLELVGAQGAADIKAYVTQGASVPPPNAPSTVAAKGSDRTLVATGQMIGAVTWEVKK